MAYTDTAPGGEKLDFIAEARKRLKLGLDFDEDDRSEARMDWRFFASDQWSEEDKARRQQDGRPCVTMNQIAPKVRQIMNQIRAHRPQAEVVADLGANEEDSEIVEGMLRRIQASKYADLAHDWAAECALIGGFGSWRICADYPNDRSMRQELYPEPILDPFSVVWDPNSQKPDKSDAEWCFVTQSISKEEFKREYPDASLMGADIGGLGDTADTWISENSLTIADYFHCEYETQTLFELPDGTTAYAEELAEKGITPEKDWPSREVDVRVVNWCKINAVEKLKEYEWRGKYIPIVTVEGQKIVLEGRCHMRGFVRDLRDPQVGYNWMTSGIYEAIGAGTKAPWIAPEGMIEDHEQEWRWANRQNQSVLQYKILLAPDGTPMQFKPERNIAEPPIQAVSEARAQADQDFKSVSGMYDASMGNAVMDQSGKAIQSLQAQANMGTYNFGDNLVFALEHEARIIIDLMPHYYDAAQTIEVEGRSRNKKKVQVYNSNLYSDAQPVPQDPEAEAMLDLAKGQFTPNVTVGPSFETQRQKDLEFWLRLAEADPTTMQIGRDIIYSLVDSPESKAMEERAKAVLPPPVLQAISGDQPDPNMLAAQNQQMSQMVQHMGQMIQQLQEVIKTKQIEGQSRIQVQQLKVQEAALKADADLKKVRLQAQSDILVHAADQHIDVTHDHAMLDKKHAHEQGMAQQQQKAAAFSAAQAHELDQAAESQDQGA